MNYGLTQCRTISGDYGYVRNGNVFYILSQRQLGINSKIINNTNREWIELASNLNSTQNQLNSLREDSNTTITSMSGPLLRRLDKNFSEEEQISRQVLVKLSTNLF